MARVICFSDTAALTHMIRRSMLETPNELYVLPASRLDNSVRAEVQSLIPDIILLELNRSLDNAHLFFFLRADQAIRHIPVIVISTSARLEQQADMLGADGYLRLPFDEAQLADVLAAHMPRELELAAA